MFDMEIYMKIDMEIGMEIEMEIIMEIGMFFRIWAMWNNVAPPNGTGGFIWPHHAVPNQVCV